MSKENDSPKTITIEHCRASNYSSHFATGAFFAGPTADGMFHLTFFSEARRLKREIGTPIGGDPPVYSVTFDKQDLEDFREDKATITVSANVARNIADLIYNILDTTQKNNTPG